jgi:hypothetical protein
MTLVNDLSSSTCKVPASHSTVMSSPSPAQHRRRRRWAYSVGRARPRRILPPSRIGMLVWYDRYGEGTRDMRQPSPLSAARRSGLDGPPTSPAPKRRGNNRPHRRTVRHQHLPSSAAPTRFTSTIRDADGSKPTVRNRPPTVPGPKAPKPLVRLGVRTVRTVRTVPSPSPWHEGGTAPTRASVATAPTLARPPRGPWTVAAGRGLPCLRQGVLSHPPASACRARPLARRKVWATSYTAALLAQRAQVDREGLRPARPPGCASRSSR